MKHLSLLILGLVIIMGSAQASDFCELKTFHTYNPATRTHTDQYVAVCTNCK